MNQTLRKSIPAMVMALCLCAAPTLCRTEELSAADLQTVTTIRAQDKLTVAENGETYYMQGDERVTGKFSLEPNFLLGDVNNDNTIDASDAAVLLEASAAIGAGETMIGITAEEDALFRLYADADGNGEINAADAAEILTYAAKYGVGEAVHPLGFAYYYADENGVLLSGRIEDTATGETYYADENYRLLTGWIHTEEGIFYLDNEGVMQKNMSITTENGNIGWLGEDGILVMTGWMDTGAGLSYLDTDGNAVNGFRIIDDAPYYFENNLMQTGWIVLETGTAFAFEDGKLCQGLRTIGEDTYYFDENYTIVTGWLTLEQGNYYFNADGIMVTGWMDIAEDSYIDTYYFDENGIRQSGLVTTETGIYFLDADGIRRVGWQTLEGNTYYFSPESCLITTGWLTLEDKTYYFDENGVQMSGWQTIGDNQYYFGEGGVMATALATIDGVRYKFSADGVCLGEYREPVTDADLLVNTAVRHEPVYQIPVYDQQVGEGKEVTEFTIYISNEDIATIERFAAENFPENATLAEKLRITHQWIHYNVEYAYAGELWDEIVNLSYVDAVFNHQKGQCVQYNGAMASVLAYYGFDVYMVKGWTSPGTQHYWTEVEIDGYRYYVECGNYGKNGEWQYFFKLLDD